MEMPTCSYCGKVITGKAVTCVCHKYDSSRHEGSEWCSEDCADNSHPDAYMEGGGYDGA